MPRRSEAKPRRAVSASRSSASGNLAPAPTSDRGLIADADDDRVLGNLIRCATCLLLGRNFTYRPAGSLDLRSLALRINNPKRGRITGLPIVPPSVQRLKPPPLPGPVGSHGRVAVMDFRHQLRIGSQPRSSATFVRTSRSTPKQKGILRD